MVGCGLAAFGIWNLQGAGRGLAASDQIQQKSEAAWEKVVSAQAALATTDFASSEAEFIEAEQLLGEARQELDNSLAASRRVLELVDVTGTVQSGRNILLLGQALTKAGQAAARGLAPLVSAAQTNPLADNGPDSDLIAAINITRQEFDQAAAELETAEKLLAEIDSPFLPAEVKEKIDTLNASVPKARRAIKGVVEQSDTYLYLLGEQTDRQYLILFANNDEIRPTGGFIGTLGLINIDRGRVENIDIQSVYDPDGQLKQFIAPPNPLLPIVDRWYLRDANWFADYEANARKMADLFEKEGGPTVDGVILMTPEVIERLLKVTGPISVPGYDITVSSENFVAVTQNEVTYNYDKETNKPKQFLADLTPILLNRLFESGGQSDQKPLEGKLAVVASLAQSLQAKDLLLFFRDDAAQNHLRRLNWAGNVPADKPGFLAVINANIGGHKSDQFMDQEIDHRLQINSDGRAEAVVTIRRTHNGPAEVGDFEYPEGENPAFKNNVIYQRALVPKGSQLLEAKGFASAADVPQAVIPGSDTALTVDADIAQWQQGQRMDPSGTVLGSESGYDFFANWIITQPGQTSVALYRYKLPDKFNLPSIINPAEDYSTYFMKQAGAQRTTIRASLSLPQGYRIIHTVPASGITADGDKEIVYRGEFKQDIIIGAVVGNSL